MAIPIAYNFRNLIVRKTTTIMTALGIALTVAVLLAILAMLHGLRTALVSTGDPLHVLVLRKGANSELVSNFTREAFQTLKQREGKPTDCENLIRPNRCVDAPGLVIDINHVIETALLLVPETRGERASPPF